MPEKRSILAWLDGTGVPLLLIRVVLGGMFVYLAWNKITAEPSLFLKAVRMYQVLPPNPPALMNSVAIVLPWLELVCGLALIVGVFIRGAALTTLVMLATFTPALYMHSIKLMTESPRLYATICDVSFDCGCGTGVEWMCTKIPTNLGLLVLSVLALKSNSRKFCLSSRLLNRKKPVPVTPAADSKPARA